MSLKGRGEALDDTGQDFYPTPVECTRVFAAAYRPPPGLLFDPCCGDGAIIRAWPLGRRWLAADIRPEAVEQTRASLPGGLLEWSDWGDCREMDEIGSDVGAIITNPPYSIAAEIIMWALAKRSPQTDVVMLLRLPWMCPKRGREWIRVQAPDVYVLSDRPKFRPNKQGKMASDMADYGWFVWPASEPSASRTEGRILYCPEVST